MNPQFISSFHSATVAVPAPELLLMVVTLSLCLLCRLNRMGLMISYLFSVHMGWMFCHRELLAKSPDMLPYVVGYFFFAGVVMVLAIIGMNQSSE